jgi:hypothetical protein
MTRLRATFALTFTLVTPWASAADTFRPADYVAPAVCPAYYGQANAAMCAVDTAKVAALGKDACNAAGFTFVDVVPSVGTASAPAAAASAATAKASCTVPAAKQSVPAECKAMFGRNSAIEGTGKDARCVYTPTVPTSTPGAYRNDCFFINAVPASTGLKPGTLYFTTKQVDNGEDSPTLTLVEAKPGRLYGCSPKEAGDKPPALSADVLMEAGAERRGYSFGLLTMPYKYFPKQKAFAVNAPIGGYFGWRNGQFGSGTTYALAVTLSSVVAESLDPNTKDAAGNSKITGTTNVAALSIASGVIWDVLKTPRGKPFKAGFFVGQDLVNQDTTFNYKYNRKTWIAIQFGFDFTDN